MRTSVCALCALLLAGVCWQEVDCILLLKVTSEAVPQSSGTTCHPGDLARLPGLCRRLRRRRLSYLCHKRQFCWGGRSQGQESGQVCRCPRGSRCSRVFIHSL
ncbi:uncharacterized protein si:ch211-191i18.4 [Dunckerocampus dactyliophorus]|uniref:uncharacterized protein si:ch211-191i18.4 n=1 Tax=Dunckerocampus dactyliophorus TaxID=161453 RepID=UPI002404CBEC|nr:uncharacterized protein si:ch211-191i18.4 [Dunckerocampus dactyliophorus]